MTDTPKSVGDIKLAERTNADIHPVKTPFLSVEAARRADVLRQADQAARAVSPSIVQVSAGLISRAEFVRIDAILREKFSPVWGGLYHSVA